MKNIFAYLLGAFLVFSCSTSSDSDNNTSTDPIPLSPTELKVSLTASSQATLNWTDNSTNETGFKIERKSGNENYAPIGSVGSDITVFMDNDLLPSTIYTYRVLAYNKVGNSPTYSNQVAITTSKPITVPVIGQTYKMAETTATTASSGGNISSDGGGEVTSRGVVWSTSPNPTISLATKTSNGTGIGDFQSDLSALTPKMTYYVRAYATNSAGTSYGNEISFVTLQLPYSFTQGSNISDIDGNTYPTIITSCSQTWMIKNLNVSHYRNGDVIPQVTDPKQWENLTTGAWCYYANNTVNGTVYGKLYNWYAVNDPRGLAPKGWHIPTYPEYDILADCLGGVTNAGGKMKEVGTTHWTSPNISATNTSGFVGLPGGGRLNNGSFDYIGQLGTWWTTTEFSTSHAYRKTLSNNSSSFGYNGDGKVIGYSVRCVKD